jgi:hypothetical protein
MTQKIPSTDLLYLTLMSLTTRFLKSSLYLSISEISVRELIIFFQELSDHMRSFLFIIRALKQPVVSAISAGFKMFDIRFTIR